MLPGYPARLEKCPATGNSLAAYLTPTDARKATVRRFGRIDRSAQYFAPRTTPVGESGVWHSPSCGGLGKGPFNETHED